MAEVEYEVQVLTHVKSSESVLSMLWKTEECFDSEQEALDYYAAEAQLDTRTVRVVQVRELTRTERGSEGEWLGLWAT